MLYDKNNIRWYKVIDIKNYLNSESIEKGVNKKKYFYYKFLFKKIGLKNEY